MRTVMAVAIVVAAAGCAVRHEGRGLVLRVDRAAATVTVSHEAIAGYMAAMVMPFEVGDAAGLADVEPGDRIAFRITARKGRTNIDRLRLLSAAPDAVGTGAGSPGTATRAVPVAIRPGQPVPDFTLISHRGQPLTLSSLRGRLIAVTFVYTRCPLPDYCPRMMTNLRAVRKRFAAQLGSDLELLTVTFDPQYDTPETLAGYARRYGADLAGWHFLTGTRDAVARVCALFGVEFWPDEGLITHTLRTAVIDREGRLAATIEGKDYSGEQLGDLIAELLRR